MTSRKSLTQCLTHNIPVVTGSCWLSTVATENVNVGREWWEGPFEESAVLTHLKIIQWKRSVSGSVVFEEILMFSFVLVCFFNWKKWFCITVQFYLQFFDTSTFKKCYYWSIVGHIWGFPGVSDGKASACNAGNQGLIPRSGRSPGEGNGTHSSILAWRIPWAKEPGLDMTEQLTLSLFHVYKFFSDPFPLSAF